jgi:hypothetical protein
MQYLIHSQSLDWRLWGRGAKNKEIFSFFTLNLYYLLIFSYLCIYNFKICTTKHHHIIIFNYTFRRGDSDMFVYKNIINPSEQIRRVFYF